MKKTVNKIVVAVILIGLLCIQASAKGYAVEESFTLEPGEVIYIEESEFSELDILIEYSPSSVELMYGVADEPDPHRGDHQSYIATHGRASNYIRPDQDHYYIFVGNLSLTDDVDVDLSYSTFIELRRAPREERNIVRKRIPLNLMLSVTQDSSENDIIENPDCGFDVVYPKDNLDADFNISMVPDEVDAIVHRKLWEDDRAGETPKSNTPCAKQIYKFTPLQ